MCIDLLSRKSPFAGIYTVSLFLSIFRDFHIFFHFFRFQSKIVAMGKNFFPRLTKTIFEVWKKPNPVLKSDFGYLFSNWRYSKKTKFLFFINNWYFLLILWFLFSKLVQHQTKHHRNLEKDHNRREIQDEATGEVGFELRPLWATLFTKNWKRWP